MIRIILCCASGMSTSLLVQKMEQAAKERQLQTKIWAVSANEIKENAKDADIILLGPQVRHAKKAIEADADGKPVVHIGIKEYGMMNGNAVLNQVLEVLGK